MMNETKATKTKGDKMTGMKIETVVVQEDARVEGYGVFEAGTYLIEMPAGYDPKLVSADDIIRDESVRVIGS